MKNKNVELIETQLKPRVSVYFPGYLFVRLDRATSWGGGCNCVAFKHQLLTAAEFLAQAHRSHWCRSRPQCRTDHYHRVLLLQASGYGFTQDIVKRKFSVKGEFRAIGPYTSPDSPTWLSQFETKKIAQPVVYQEPNSDHNPVVPGWLIGLSAPNHQAQLPLSQLGTVSTMRGG